MKKFFYKINTYLLISIGSIVAVTGALGNTVGASASGASYWGTYVVKGVPVPTGKYTVSVAGTGTRVDVVAGSFKSFVPVCNWNITAEFFDSNNKWYKTVESLKNYSCSLEGFNSIGFVGGYTAKRGYVCSTLKQNGSRVTSWCAAIN